MENRSHALAAGIFVLLLGITIVLAVWFLGDKGDSTDNYVLTTTRKVTGLNLQAQVRYRGIRAGKVESIAPDAADPRLILVNISIDHRYRLTPASTAQLGYQGITGLAYVDLNDDGSSKEFLPIDDAHPARIAMQPSLMDTLGDKAGDIVSQLAEVTARLNRVLDARNTANFARTLDNLAEVSDGLKQAPQVLAAMREALSEPNLKKLNLILTHVEKTAGEAAPLTAELREMVTTMAALARKVDLLADQTSGAISGTTLPRLNALAQELGNNSRQLGRVLDMLEESPQALVFGKGAARPGPGESGFTAPQPTGN